MISLLAFVVWVCFFDKNDVITKYKNIQKLQHLKKEKEYYYQAIKADRLQIYQLKTDVNNLEKFAREQYYMKRKNEDLFIIIDKNHPVKKEI
jgi:cell division protein DivIC